jgi:hypothetical protein
VWHSVLDVDLAEIGLHAGFVVHAEVVLADCWGIPEWHRTIEFSILAPNARRRKAPRFFLIDF